MTLDPASLVASHDHIDEVCFDHIYEIYYGTDDGYDELRPREEARHDARHVERLYEIFRRYEDFYASVAAERRAHIHYASVVGGLYGLNLIPIFRPREITFFDVNPHEITFFEIIRRVWIASRSAAEFVGRLSIADYEVQNEQEDVIRTCIAARQNGRLEDNRGRSARTFLSSWRYALDHYELTRDLLATSPTRTFLGAMQSRAFADFVGAEPNLWIYCSNIMEFVTFDLTFGHPANAALFASYYEETDMLDLASSPHAPARVRCRVPMEIGSPA